MLDLPTLNSIHNGTGFALSSVLLRGTNSHSEVGASCMQLYIIESYTKRTTATIITAEHCHNRSFSTTMEQTNHTDVDDVLPFSEPETVWRRLSHDAFAPTEAIASQGEDPTPHIAAWKISTSLRIGMGPEFFKQ